MAEEILSWKSIAAGNTYVYPYTGGVYDTGAVRATLTTTTAGSNSYVSINNDGSNPINSPDYAQDSQLSLYGDDAAGTRAGLTVSFEDDTSDSITSGVSDLRFAINDIDAGSQSSFQDVITIRATSTTGDPLTISATPGCNFTVVNNADGSVSLVGISGTNSYNSANSFSEISISGGDIASFSVEFSTARNNYAANNILLSDIKYTTGQAVCFAAGTEIETRDGPKKVEDIRVGDHVQTLDHGWQPVRWLDHTRLTHQGLTGRPGLHPIRIRAGALGAGRPAKDLVVSPMHRVLVRSAIVRRMFGVNEALICAKHLLVLDGVDYEPVSKSVLYYHVMLDQHGILIANGCEAESFYPGPEALKMVGELARQELRALGLCPKIAPKPARLLVEGRRARRLVERHRLNAKDMVEDTPQEAWSEFPVSGDMPGPPHLGCTFGQSSLSAAGGVR